MKKSLLLAAAFAAVAAIVACGSGSGSDSGSNLPDRNPGSDASTPPPSSSSGGTDSGGTASCSGSTLQTSDIPACDTCVKDKCCKQVQDCESSFDCKAMQQCISQCATDDVTCILTCSEAHDKGTALLQEVASCAQFLCAAQCPDQTPDGGLLGDAF